MYLQNVGFQKGFLDGLGVEGAVFSVGGQNVEELLRREYPANLRELLFDPQLYFLDFDLSVAEFPTLIARLATFPWFGIDAPQFDSDAQRRSDWKRDIAENLEQLWDARRNPLDDWEASVGGCVRVQLGLGVTKVILPATLVADPDRSLDADFARLDRAVDVARGLTDLPLLASVPLDESAVMYRPFLENTAIDALADGISARDALTGAYVPFTSSGVRDRLSSQNAAGSLMRIAQLLGRDAGREVVLNFCETLGLACLGLGAASYASGYTRRERRFSIDDFRDRGFGRAIPKLLSLSLVLDLFPERDLERLARANLLRLLEPDRSARAEDLLQALAAGQPSGSIPEWEERRNNIPAARAHYSELQQAWASRGWASTADVLAWLQNAEAQAIYLTDRFRDDPLTFDASHLAPWRQALETLLADG